MTKAAALLAAAVAIGGCGSANANMRPVKLDELRDAQIPVYYVGNRFEDLDITYAKANGLHAATVAYGTCEPPPNGLFDEGGCAAPLEIQSKACPPDSAVVTIYSDGHGRAARAAKALRPLNDFARTLGRPLVSIDRGVRC